MTLLNPRGQPLRPSGDGTGKHQIKISSDPARGLIILQVGKADPVGVAVAQALVLSHRMNELALSMLLESGEED